MARIEWIKQRLNNWALWKARESSGGLGFATQAAFLEDRVDRYREVSLNSTIDTTDASLTDQAVESLKLPRPHLYETLHCIYIRDKGIKGTARQLCKAESTIKQHLDDADHALSAWFGARAERKKSSTT
jgi:Phage antitermination protein Q